jgi:hypothetical protein
MCSQVTRWRERDGAASIEQGRPQRLLLAKTGRISIHDRAPSSAMKRYHPTLPMLVSRAIGPDDHATAQNHCSGIAPRMIYRPASAGYLA